MVDDDKMKMTDEQFDQFMENLMEAFPKPTFWERVAITRASRWAFMSVVGAMTSLVMSASHHDTFAETMFTMLLCAVVTPIITPIIWVLCSVAWEQVTAKD